jgi:hypothetical protein
VIWKKPAYVYIARNDSGSQKDQDYGEVTLHGLDGPRVQVEYEQEMENAPLTKSTSTNW